ncbi:SDR family oxidoreductase [candidate division KSB1 bacterium]|nr:SDR family oxidoreductase [candidate division KSB1 bacterium]MBL7095129.1 SDR family oxidoreductase [candidate division KSB1 bacterium]
MRFEHKIILVTGSTRGIGLATALKFASEGGTIIVHGPDESDEFQNAFRQVSIISPQSIKLPCELSDSNAIREMFVKIESHYRRLDVLVNNAVSQNSVPFLDITEENWDHVFAVNLKAPFLCSQLAAKMMIKNSSGKIINIGSVHEFQTKRNYAHYSTSKGGLLMLTKNMALELAEHNIQVNQITPGAIASALTDADRQKQFLSAIPAGKVGKPPDIASMTCFLASNEADYITGSSFVVDGGLTLGFCASRPDL